MESGDLEGAKSAGENHGFMYSWTQPQNENLCPEDEFHSIVFFIFDIFRNRDFQR